MTQPTPRSTTRGTGTMWAAGASTFAASLMLLAGVFQAVEGIAALVNGTDFLVRSRHYVFVFNATTWGWIHLILGACSPAPEFHLHRQPARPFVGIAAAMSLSRTSSGCRTTRSGRSSSSPSTSS